MNALIKTCSNPTCPYGKTFMIPERHFNKNKNRKDGLSHYCKGCSKDSSSFHMEVPKTKVVCKREGCTNTFMSTGHKKFCGKRCRAKYHSDREDKESENKRKKKYMKKLFKIQGTKNAGKRWTDAELLKGREMRIDGKTWIEVSVALGRSIPSCWKHISPLEKKFKEMSKGIIK